MSKKTHPHPRHPKATATPEIMPFPRVSLPHKSTTTILLLAEMVLAGLTAFAWLMPELRVWGVHHLAFLPLPLSVTLFVLAMLFIVPPSRTYILSKVSSIPSLPNRSIWLWPLLAIAIFYLFRVSVPLLGDGQLWIKQLAWTGELAARGQEVPSNRWQMGKEPLEMAIHEAVFRSALHVVKPTFAGSLLAENSPSPREKWFADLAWKSHLWVSIAAGALFVILLLRFARHRLPPSTRTPFILLFFSSGGMLLFFGYVEHYTLVSLAVLAFLFSALDESFPPRRFPMKTFITFGLAVASHYLALFLTPAFLFLLFNLFLVPSDLANKRSNPQRQRILWFVGICALLGLAGYVYVNGWNGWFTILPLLTDLSSDGYALLSLNHVIDLLNLVFLIGFPALFIFSVLPTAPSAPPFLRIQQGVLLLAALGGIALVFSFSPNLGMARDWDLLTVPLWPLLILAGWKLATTDIDSIRNELIGLLLCFMLLITVPFILEQTRDSISISRFQTLLRLDRSRSAYGWENLAAYYERNGDLPHRISAWRSAVEVGPNPRYLMNLSIALRQAGQLEEAESFCLRAVQDYPKFAPQINYLTKAYIERGSFDKARELARLTLEKNPVDSTATQLLRNLDQQLTRRSQ